jgi:hypothetical protein
MPHTVVQAEGQQESQNKLKDYCDYYNIPFENLVDIISDLKVVPMIRGKGFEFTVTSKLKQILPTTNWKVSNPTMNAQFDVHDVDVEVIRNRDGRKISIECKLAKKDSFRMRDNIPNFAVKCMRSRTVSDNDVATKLAERYGVPRTSVLMHADNYQPKDFDFVVTSLGNTFWTTLDKKYVFSGTKAQFEALSSLFPDHFGTTFTNTEDFRRKTFDFLLIARSKDIAVSEENGIICVREKCIRSGNARTCGFIPNYPVVNLTDVANDRGPWKLISNASDLFNEL